MGSTKEKYIHFENLANSVAISSDSIVSRTILNDNGVKMIVFGFDAGQELSEHTASVPAVIHLLRGEAELTLGKDRKLLSAGSWSWMPPQLPHSIIAKTPIVMLLTMLKNNAKVDV